MSYVDGFIVPVPKKNLLAYRRLSQKAGKIWREYGATDYKAKRMIYGGFKVFIDL